MLATLMVLGIGLAFLLLYRFYMVVFILFVAVALQIAIAPAVAWLRRHGVRRGWDVAIIYALLLAFVGAVVWMLAPLLATQMQTVGRELPDYYESLRTYLSESHSRLLRMLLARLPEQLPARIAPPPVAADSLEAVAPAWQLFATASRVVFIVIATFMLAYYWSLEGELVVRQLLLRIPIDRRDEWRELIAEMESKIGGYLRGQAILSLLVGVLSTVAFLLLGIPNALVLGLIMGIFEAIPILGPTLGAIPAVLMTLSTAPDKTLWVIVALVAIQSLENHLLVPRVMNQSVGVNAIVSILAIAAFGLLFGLGGAIMAIPLAAILQILLNHLLFEAPVPEQTLLASPEEGNGVRTRISVLRLQAQELAQDLRKQVRADTNSGQPEEEQAEDELEAIATDLSSLLAQMERPA
jgi:predicted PurR-regulated permease PerM